ncbi:MULTISPECIES: type 1 glutamine amidotransferase domain-containing protein [unclassified Cupriavidus]|uniref:type 1 glutamine amidotransferase domain-containing protein n=1 Tax=Cupriavidus sp. H19C3 TaxID=3241603 RepID=UPI0011DA1080|nr:MAG: type 1 glutamine amidotransferase domain-containing protein [Cupriavidus sp.]
MKILMVLTSHDTLGNTGKKTGFWLEELAAPYYVFKDAGAEIVLASPKGGQPPLDPKSNEPDFQTADTRRFEADAEARAHLAATRPLKEVAHDSFDAVFYPGGHGPLWDLTNDAESIGLLERTIANHKPLAMVCHAPGALRFAKSANGNPLVEGKSVTGFSNSEEAAVQLVEVVPYLVEDVLKQNGAKYSSGPDWQSHVVEDGLLITGQNPGSSADTARALLKRFRT